MALILKEKQAKTKTNLMAKDNYNSHNQLKDGKRANL